MLDLLSNQLVLLSEYALGLLFDLIHGFLTDVVVVDDPADLPRPYQLDNEPAALLEVAPELAAPRAKHELLRDPAGQSNPYTLLRVSNDHALLLLGVDQVQPADPALRRQQRHFRDFLRLAPVSNKALGRVVQGDALQLLRLDVGVGQPGADPEEHVLEGVLHLRLADARPAALDREQPGLVDQVLDISRREPHAAYRPLTKPGELASHLSCVVP